MYASQTWTKDLIGKTLKSAQDKGLLGTDEITISSTEPTGDDKPKFWLDPDSASANTNNVALTSGFAYDTTEQVVGCWTNGKPIYRKTVYHYGFVNGSTVIDSTLTNEIIDYFSVKSFFMRNTSTGDTWDGLSTTYIAINMNASGLVAYCNVNWEIEEAYLTVEYTKTTDAENSFKVSMLGASAIDIPEAKEVYSTDETVCGTWIDGKPIYQRTYSVTTPNQTDAVVVSPIDDLDICIEISGILNQSPYNWIPIPCYYNSSATISMYYQYNASVSPGIHIYPIGDGYSNQAAYITIKYTKTTD